MEFEFHTLLQSANGLQGLWETFGGMVEKVDKDFLDLYPNMPDWLRAMRYWLAAIVVITVLGFIKGLPSMVIAIFNRYLWSRDKKAEQQAAANEKILPPPRCKSIADFANTAAERGRLLVLLRDAVSGIRIASEGPYAATIIAEILTFEKQHFEMVRVAFKAAARRFDEVEEHIRHAITEIFIEQQRAIDKVNGNGTSIAQRMKKAQMALNEAEVNYTDAFAEASRHSLFGYFFLYSIQLWTLKIRKYRARFGLRQVQADEARLKKRIEAHHKTNLQPLLVEMDYIIRQELIPLTERFRSDVRSLVVTAMLGRTVRRLLDTTNEGKPIAEAARKQLGLEHLPWDVEELRVMLKHELKGRFTPSPITPLEDWFEAYIRRYWALNPHLVAAEGIDPEWLKGLAPVGSKGLAEAQFGHTYDMAKLYT
ncbi:MAG: hypothetical protein WAX89_03605 [Alphaproteobacteria bacterium]